MFHKPQRLIFGAATLALLVLVVNTVLNPIVSSAHKAREQLRQQALEQIAKSAAHPATSTHEQIPSVQQSEQSPVLPPPIPKPLPPAELAARIDQLFAEYWKSKNITPTNAASDGKFLRRASLDITGKIPTAGEAREFLADATPDKRAELIRRLLRHARFSNHLAVTLRDSFLPNAQNDPQKAVLIPGFESWLRLRLADGVGYDKLVHEMLVARVNRNANDAVLGRVRAVGPEAFSMVHEDKPELIAGSAGRALLGIQIQCAECHDHPFADWKQDQFWSFAALFVTPTTTATAAMAAPSLELEIPNKNKRVTPRFLDGTIPSLASPGADERRNAVSKWILVHPQFARSAANQVWMHFMGRGLVHPADDFGPNNPASHPEVLDLLAENFVRSGYDLKYLAEAVATTKIYGLSSRQTHESQKSPTHFALMPVRSMTPEQLYDSITRASRGRFAQEDVVPANPIAAMAVGGRAEFLRRFWEPGERTGSRGSILHALTLLNGNLTAEAIDPKTGPQIRAIINSPFLDDSARIDTMYLATLSRYPTSKEQQVMLAHVKHSGTEEDRTKKLSDVYWALLNSSEFLLTP